MIKKMITEQMFDDLEKIEKIYLEQNDCYQNLLVNGNLNNAERLVAEALESKTFVAYNTIYNQMEHICRFNKIVENNPEWTDFMLDCIIEAVDTIDEYERVGEVK